LKIDTNTSDRISILRFPLIVGIVFIHSFGVSINVSDTKIGIENVSFFASSIQYLVSQVLARISVPLFFTISGFLFFNNYELSFHTVSKKMKARAKTLLIPYIFWNSFALLTYFILQSIPDLNQFFSGNIKPVSNYGIYDYLNTYLGLRMTANFPAAYQFWFIRDLIIMVMISPLFWITARHCAATTLIATFALWVLSTDIIVFNLSSTAVLFFFLGAVISIRKIDLSFIDQHGLKISIIYFISAVLYALALNGHFPYSTQINSLVIILGILSIWFFAGKVINSSILFKVLSILSGSSFFIFAAHEPFILGGIRKLIYYIAQPSSSLQITIFYFLAPILTIIITLLLDKSIKSAIPSFHNIITGGRRK